MHEIRPVHLRRFEHFRGLRKFLFRDAQVAEYLFGKALGKLAVIAPHQGHTFVARDVARADFLRCIVGGAADAELGEGGVVVKIVDAVVDAVVLAVGSGRALG
jgi:hypothetical protein